ncbi:hypothetical protein D7X94_08720 [Acutalibacter sp. 1XD8-33]|nr:hypothetical protein D7X94_08720 [Acutalibacter sp. 1XD8-33]
MQSRRAGKARPGKGGGGVMDFSKKLISDIRWLLWAVTLGGLLLAAYCIRNGYVGSLPWLSAMVGLPWTAHGVVCSFYLNMAKSDHKQGGITFESAKANRFDHHLEGGAARE